MGHIAWNRILREANQVADGLTKNSLMKEEDYHNKDSFPLRALENSFFYFFSDSIVTIVWCGCICIVEPHKPFVFYFCSDSMSHPCHSLFACVTSVSALFEIRGNKGLVATQGERGWGGCKGNGGRRRKGSDEDCRKILENCKEAISSKSKTGKVIVIDVVINEKKDEHEITRLKLLMDLNMACLLNGKERREEDWKKLFVEAGFQSYKISPLTGYLSLIEIYP
ncbi:hypothetical protein JHK84_051584 [Glycine max]|nr:hypothetical protein JHK84_051584 [Glycine max]